MAAHTLGPWAMYVRIDGDIEITEGAEGGVLATVYGDDHAPDCWPVTPNARLIAAAPELLEALKECVAELNLYQKNDIGEWVSNVVNAIDEARAAIQKAEGES